MDTYTLEREQWIDRPLETVFALFSDAANLAALTPPWLQLRIVTPTPIAMSAGTLIEYRIRWHGLPLRWQTQIVDWSPPQRFVDVQLRGPYHQWQHTHTFTEEKGGTRIGDSVCYSLPLGPLGALAHRISVRRELEAVFDYRAEQIERVFATANLTK